MAHLQLRSAVAPLLAAPPPVAEGALMARPPLLAPLYLVNRHMDNRHQMLSSPHRWVVEGRNRIGRVHLSNLRVSSLLQRQHCLLS